MPLSLWGRTSKSALVRPSRRARRRALLRMRKKGALLRMRKRGALLRMRKKGALLRMRKKGALRRGGRHSVRARAGGAGIGFRRPKAPHPPACRGGLLPAGEKGRRWWAPRFGDALFCGALRAGWPGQARP